MNKNKLQLPAQCTILNADDMSFISGGGIVSDIFYALGRMFRSTKYSSWDNQAAALEQAHGAVVSYHDGVYTYSDGFTYSTSHGSSFSTNIGDFFYGVGQLFDAFGL